MTEISNIASIQNQKSMEKLYLSNTQVANLWPLSGLHGLRHLDLHNSQAQDLTPLSGLLNLEFLDLAYLGITDVSALSGLHKLKYINMKNNGVLDFRPFRDINVSDSRAEYEGQPVGFAQCDNDRLIDFDLELCHHLGAGYDAYRATVSYLKSLDDTEYDRRLDIYRKHGASEEQLLSDRIPLAEEIVQDQDTGAFDLLPTEIARPRLLSATIQHIADCINDVLANPSNGLSNNSLEIKRLHRTLNVYGTDSQRIEMDLTYAFGSIQRQIKSLELPLSEEIGALLEALKQGAQAIRESNPEIAENRRLLQGRTTVSLTPEAIDQIVGAGPILEEITQGTLRKQIQEDIEALSEAAQATHPKLPGVTNKDRIVVPQDEALRILGRSARMLLILRKSPNAVYDSPAYKGASIISTLYNLARIVWSIFS